MSMKWPGGLIRKTPVTPTGPLQNGTAPGMWTLAEASYWTKQGLWPTAGNFLAVEDVFSTYLYTGSGTTQTITNGIDLAGKGGLVWLKRRNSTAQSHGLFDTSRGENPYLSTDLAIGQYNANNGVVYNSNGFTNKVDSFFGGAGDGSGTNYVSWTFREAPNFFDIVTWTGNGANRNIAHNLGSVPGMIIVKRTDTTGDWQVYHRSNANTQYQVLNSTAAVATGTTRWNSTTPTATEFTVGTDATVNASGGTYVAYLYAHDTSSTGLIQCGSYTETGSAVTVNLGWEPQWLMVKRTNSTGNWVIIDNMRALNMSTTNGAVVFPNTSGAETNDPYWHPTATGFVADPYWGSGASVVYMAIRRGPMKTPTLGTSVFAPVLYTGNGSTSRNITVGFPVDFFINANPTRAWNSNNYALSRLTNTSLKTDTTAAEAAIGSDVSFTTSNANTGIFLGSVTYNGNTYPFVDYFFRRAPGFMDVVCYTGTGSATTFNHNLGVAPELMIVKRRNATNSWLIYSASVGATNFLAFDDTTNSANAGAWNNTAPTASVFTVGTLSNVNASGSTYVAYLFASCPGVSKVGSYTGNGSSQTINCGFAAGARFVMIKRTDSTGDWYVWDSARGIVAGNDPYLALNSTAAEVTTNDSVDTDNTGFIVNQVAASNVNVNGGNYIFLAIA